MEWILAALGIALGNLLSISGVVILALGFAGVMVKADEINMMVTTMSIPTAGQPQGFALKLRGLVHPRDRTTALGLFGIIAGVTMLVLGGVLIKFFA